jgi:hypothetical protein
MILRTGSRVFSRLATFSALFVALAASFCGPELTTPGDTDVSGTWFAPGPAAGLSTITMVLTQTPDGRVSGTFTATGTPGDQVCPMTGPCIISSTINGANTVLQVNLILTNGGTFTGQAIAPRALRGTMTANENAFVEFERISPP